MSTVAAFILAGAYNRAEANDPGKLAGDVELLAHLDRTYQRLWSIIARVRPDEFAALLSLTFAGSPPQAAIPQDTIALTDIRTSAGALVTLIPSSDRERLWNLGPCVYRIGSTLYSRGVGTLDPGTGDVLSVTVLAAPPSISSLASTVDARWPARHDQLLVDAVAVYLSVKDAGRTPDAHGKLMAEFQQSSGAFAAEYLLAPGALQWLHGGVERGPKVGV